MGFTARRPSANDEKVYSLVILLPSCLALFSNSGNILTWVLSGVHPVAPVIDLHVTNLSRLSAQICFHTRPRSPEAWWLHPDSSKYAGLILECIREVGLD